MESDASFIEERKVDVSETWLMKTYPDAFRQLLYDHTSRRNIIWATDSYEGLGEGYQYGDEIQPERITGENGNVIQPRSVKTREEQMRRVKDKAEVFTPSWICNKQNNLVDNAWFGREDVFNTEVDNPDGTHTWIVNSAPIVFPEVKTWRDYVNENRMEITCGEAPYLVSRYDTVTGEYIPVENRIGFLDRKLRIVGENTTTSGEWLKAAAKRIRQMARAADRLSIEERIERIAAIFSTFRNPDKETVLTPWRVVNMHMSDTLGGYTFFNDDFSETIEEPRFVDRGEVTADVFAPDSHLLEINSKSGLYPLYLAYNIYRSRLRNAMFSPETLEEHQAIWDAAVAENIFVICKTPMAKRITRRTLLGFRKGKTNMWAPDDLINKIKNQPELFIKKVHDLVGKDVKIKAIVGNPPYQEVNEGNGNGANPLYHLFIDLARKLSHLGTMIHPARFLFKAGKTPKDWNEKILSDPHFKVVDYWVKSVDVFNNVDVKGGIAITMWNENDECGPIGFFSPYLEVIGILHKVKTHNPQSFSDLVYPRDLYKLTELLYKENPWAEGRQSQGHRLDIGSSIFEVFPELFYDEAPNKDEYIGIYGLQGRERVTKWIKRDYVKLPDNIDKFKVLVPKSNGTGAIGEVLSTPVIGVPVIGHTLTFLSIGGFDKAPYAEACLKYIRTRFARLLLGTLKVTQDNPKDTWANVPMQNFTEGSDIDWSKSVEEIDAQLYAKYHLSDDEIRFIESMIKPM